MKESADHIHSFIIRIWLEETVEEPGQAQWRGHITHIPDDDRRYIQDLSEIAAYLTPYLRQMGVKIDQAT